MVEERESDNVSITKKTKKNRKDFCVFVLCLILAVALSTPTVAAYANNHVDSRWMVRNTELYTAYTTEIRPKQDRSSSYVHNDESSCASRFSRWVLLITKTLHTKLQSLDQYW
jgi:hypothetical protein